MPDEKSSINVRIAEKTHVRSIGFLGLPGGGAEGAVDVKDGKIVRIRPLHYDWRYDKDKLNPWKLEKNGKTLEPLMKSLPGTFSLAYKKRVYSPNRIKYPLKRVDWDPDGERNPQNRGKSKYKRISWDEATDIVAGEINRIHQEYGPLAILTQQEGHGENKWLQGPHGMPTLLLRKMGGYTQQIRNADSWEGWYYGAEHVWGQGLFGHMFPANNIVKDITDNASMVLVWGGDPETTTWGFCGQLASRISYFWTDIGIKQVYVCPELNYGAAVHADKWIPVLPNTDAALQLAIIYTWINEGTYNKEYVKTHAVGMDNVEAYVMGEEDSVPKTPEWASPKCGVPEWTIKALAREFAARITSIVHFFGGGLIRGPWSSEPARLECIMLGMQGLGGPGVHQCQITWHGMPRSERIQRNKLYTFGLSSAGTEYDFENRVMYPMRGNSRVNQKQFFPKTMFHEAILNPPCSWYGKSQCSAPPEDQFIQYRYPADGCPEIHMIWTDSPCMSTCWNQGTKNVEALRNPKIEFVVYQHPWLENDCIFADIILPACTTYEVNDMMPNYWPGLQFSNVMYMKQAVQPIGESKSDYEIAVGIARKLGKEELVTEGKSLDEWFEWTYESLGLPDVINWDDFKEKEYYVFPIAEDWEKDPPGLRLFHDNPEKNPLPTPTGKLEFYSARLAEHFPDDRERPPIPKWIEKSEWHDERLSSERAKKYPLLMMSNHGRWRMHAQCDDISWTREIPTCKVGGWDGYMYEPLWIHPKTASERGIEDSDIVQVYNERGSVLCGARVWERIIPGVTYVDHGSRVDWILPGELDRGGAINLISPEKTVSRNCVGMASSGYLVEVERVSMAQMEEWRWQYPEAFKKEYDPASGLRFNSWVESDI